MSESKKLSVKQDLVFKRIFAKKGNEAFLKDFLSNFLKIKIKEIEIEHDIHLERDEDIEKLGIIDIKAKLGEDKVVNIEVQRSNEYNIIPRSTFYASKLLSEQIESGENYNKIEPVVVICILDFNYFKYDEYITKGVTVYDKHRDKILNNYIEYYYIELPKFRNANIDVEDNTTQWLAFIDGKEEKELQVIMEKNDNVKKANEELEYLEGDAAFKRRVELREKYLRDYNSAIENYEKKGREEGLAEGIAKGLAKSKEMVNKRNIEIAKKLLSKGMSVEEISNITELSKEEIEKLK